MREYLNSTLLAYMFLSIAISITIWHRGVCLSMTSAARCARRSQAHATEKQTEQWPENQTESAAARSRPR